MKFTQKELEIIKRKAEDESYSVRLCPDLGCWFCPLCGIARLDNEPGCADVARRILADIQDKEKPAKPKDKWIPKVGDQVSFEHMSMIPHKRVGKISLIIADELFFVKPNRQTPKELSNNKRYVCTRRQLRQLKKKA